MRDVNEMQDLRDWCEAVPSPAPARLAKAADRLDRAIAQETGQHRPTAPRLAPFRPSWPGWATPLASASAVIAIAAGTFAVAGAVRGARIDHPRSGANRYPGLVCVLSQGGIVTRIRDGRILAPIHVPSASDGIAVTPDGRTAYVAVRHGENADGDVIPIRLATGQVLRPITVGIWPQSMSFTANSRTAYVTNSVSETVTPIVTATNKALAPIKIGFRPDQVVAAPDGRTLYVINDNEETVTPVRTATGTALHPIRIPGLGAGESGDQIVVTPDSKTAYVIAGPRVNSGTLTPIRGDHARKPIVVPLTPSSFTLGPNGKMAYVVSTRFFRAGNQRGPLTITPIDLADGTRRPSVTIHGSSDGWGSLVIAPGGKTGYVLDTMRSAVTPIHLASFTVGKPIPSGSGPYHGGSQALFFGQDATIGYLIKSDRLVPLNTATNTTLRPIKFPALINASEATHR
jgi:YVTN family beta-propeller protein